jgi:hypothetical protein
VVTSHVLPLPSKVNPLAQSLDSDIGYTDGSADQLDHTIEFYQRGFEETDVAARGPTPTSSLRWCRPWPSQRCGCHVSSQPPFLSPILASTTRSESCSNVPKRDSRLSPVRRTVKVSRRKKRKHECGVCGLRLRPSGKIDDQVKGDWAKWLGKRRGT